METKNYVSYRRVSTDKQEDSGLGLEGQKSDIKRYIKSVNGKEIASFIDVESGRCKDRISIDSSITVNSLLANRPQLLKAIECCKKNKAILVVKESGRLSRHSLLMDFLIDSDLQFVCADNPNDNPMMIRMRTVFMEEELLKISERIKRAFKAKRERGEELYGSPDNLKQTDREKGALAVQDKWKKNENNRKVIPFIRNAMKAGKRSDVISMELNLAGYKSAKGMDFTPINVNTIYQRKIANA